MVYTSNDVAPFVKSNTSAGLFICDGCGRSYKHRCNLTTHKRLECGKEPQFNCRYCGKRSYHKASIKSHIFSKHLDLLKLEKKIF